MTTKEFLLDMKLMFEHGKHHALKRSRLNRRIAIHHLHFVVEHILKEKAKDDYFKGSLNEINFVEIITKLNGKKNMPYFNDLLNLNILRNDVQHRNHICGVEEVKLYTRVVEQFLKWSYQHYFTKDFESLKTEDLIINSKIKNHLLSSKAKIKEGDIKEAGKFMFDALGEFKIQIFKHFFQLETLSLRFGNKHLAVVLLDLCLKIMFINDINTLNKLLNVPCFVKKEENGKIWLAYKITYRFPEDITKVKEEYEHILNIILTHQDNLEFLDSQIS